MAKHLLNELVVNYTCQGHEIDDAIDKHIA
jgi:hypothetical protein